MPTDRTGMVFFFGGGIDNPPHRLDCCRIPNLKSSQHKSCRMSQRRIIITHIMKSINYFLAIALLCLGTSLMAQSEIKPDLSKFKESDTWRIHNRDLTVNKSIHLNAKEGDGLLWTNEISLANGKIEFDLKGKDTRGRSFVGFAFHVQDEEIYDAIYFRAFNFRSPERNKHSVQYISHPSYGWRKLREEHPGVYENPVSPVPAPNDWFHVTLIIDHPTVKVFVNDAKEPSLTIDQISDQKTGGIGFWVGNNSEGEFKNLTVMPTHE